MKDLFDRYAERLAPDERIELWEALSAYPSMSRRPDRRPVWLATAFAAFVTAITMFSSRPIPILRQAPGDGARATLDSRRGVRDSERGRAGSETAAPTVVDDAGATLKPPVSQVARPMLEASVPPVSPRATEVPALPLRELAAMSSGSDGVESSTQFVRTNDAIEVKAERRIDTKSSTAKQNLSGEKLKELPVDNLSQAIGTKAGVVARGGDLHFRGGRSGEVKFQIDGTSGPVAPPVIPITGGTRLPNDEAFDSMFFKNYGVNPFIATEEDALSTFAVDVDAASYTVTRRYLELGHLPPVGAVRVEEFVNFFPQDYPKFENGDFRIMIDAAPSPFGRGYHLMRVGLKGREIAEHDRMPAQLTFVIDVSGSMAREDRLELVKRSLRLLVARLRGGDQVGIVVFGNEGRVLLEPAPLSDRSWNSEGDSDAPAGAGRKRILDAIENLHPEGSTNAEHGLRLGYEMAWRAYRWGAINRVVLCSDGVANVGRTGPESILERVRTAADRGIHLSTIGFGMGNYNDVLMEQLADRGDGNHYYVDNLDEARRVFVENLTGTLQTIAKDAKVQVEFDSTRVLRYRLLGFENRDVADRDFRNDKVDAGEIGAGHEVTALYEVKLARDFEDGTLATVRLRYAEQEHDVAGAPRVHEIERRFDAAAIQRRFERTAPRFRLDAAVAEFAEMMRGSYWARGSSLTDVLSVARSAARDLPADATVAEFVSLVEKARDVDRRSKPVKRDEGP